MREALLYAFTAAPEPLWWQVAGLCALFAGLGFFNEAREMTTKVSLKGLESYETDEDKEYHSGVWVPFPGGHSFRILRAGPGNRAYARALQAALRPYQRQIEQRTMDNEVAEDIVRKVYVRHVVKDWEGFKDEQGEEVPYSPEAAEEVFRAMPELFRDIQALAQEFSTFQMAEIEEAKEKLGEA
jgi:hypothetical protein